jgi:hypothetical protein
MPSILIVPETGSDATQRFKLRERISVTDLRDAHIREQLLERIGWAVAAAEQEEQGRS